MSHLQNCSLKIYLKRALGGGVWLGGQDGCEQRIKVFVKIQKHFFWGGGGRGRVGGGGGVGGLRVDVNRKVKFLCKLKKNFFFFLGGGRGGHGGGGGGGGGGRGEGEGGSQGGCEQRIEVFVKIQKKNWGGGGPRGGVGWGVRVDVNEELKFL